MALTVLITLTTAGTNTGPFNLFSDVDGYTSAFETNVLKGSLVAGYTSYLVPDGTTTVRVKSFGTCTNYIDIAITGVTTTTTTSSSTTSTTTTTTTTIATFAFTGCGRSTISSSGACSDASINNRTFYSECAVGALAPGCHVYLNASGTIPLTGYSYIFMDTANWDVNPANGIVLALSAYQC